jgi:salicylate hydroxylase
MRTLARMLSPANFEELQRISYRGENVDGINHRHWRTGEILTTAISPHSPRHLQEGRTSRVALHRLLMKEVPDGVFNYGKHVVQVEKRHEGDHNGSKMRLHFADGSTTDADVVVAADGLYSVSASQLPLERIQMHERESLLAWCLVYLLRAPRQQKLRTQYLPDSTVKYLGRVSYRHIVPWETVQHIKGLPTDTSSWRRNGEVAFMSPIGSYY